MLIISMQMVKKRYRIFQSSRAANFQNGVRLSLGNVMRILGQNIPNVENNKKLEKNGTYYGHMSEYNVRYIINLSLW